MDIEIEELEAIEQKHETKGIIFLIIISLFVIAGVGIGYKLYKDKKAIENPEDNEYDTCCCENN